MTTSGIAHFTVRLDDVKPVVQRRLQVPLTLRLDRLHLVLQAALGWTDSHLYEIRAGGVGWGLPDPDFEGGPLDARKARLFDVLKDADTKTIKYRYDFGDGWEHTIKVERIAEMVPGLVYPVLVEASGRCPPEDVGGPWGYSEFLKAIADPKHEEHLDVKRWVGADYDPEVVDVDALTAAVDALARRWSRKPSARHPSTR